MERTLPSTSGGMPAPLPLRIFPSRPARVIPKPIARRGGGGARRDFEQTWTFFFYERQTRAIAFLYLSRRTLSLLHDSCKCSQVFFRNQMDCC